MKLELDAKYLRVKLEGWEKVFAIKSSLNIPIEHIKDVSTDLPRMGWKTLRAPGTCVPGLLTAGTYYTKKEKWEKEFWYVTRGGSKTPLTIELENEPYKKIVLGFEDNQRWVETIKRRLTC